MGDTALAGTQGWSHRPLYPQLNEPFIYGLAISGRTVSPRLATRKRGEDREPLYDGECLDLGYPRRLCWIERAEDQAGRPAKSEYGLLAVWNDSLPTNFAATQSLPRYDVYHRTLRMQLDLPAKAGDKAQLSTDLYPSSQTAYPAAEELLDGGHCANTLDEYPTEAIMRKRFRVGCSPAAANRTAVPRLRQTGYPAAAGVLAMFLQGVLVAQCQHL
ncbi:hypothetical protein V8D89_011000 [Ganoderma adspersum]